MNRRISGLENKIVCASCACKGPVGDCHGQQRRPGGPTSLPRTPQSVESQAGETGGQCG